MAASDMENTWETIRQGIKEAELLMNQRQYNLSMIKCRQVLEMMVYYLCTNAGIEEENLAESINILYDNGWIDKTSCEHYNKIRLLGNRATHEGYDSAYDANNAYRLLYQEVYTFANESKSQRGQPENQNSRSRNSGRRDYDNRESRSRASSSRNSNRRNSGSRSRKRQDTNGFSITPTDIIRIVLIIAVVVILVLIIRIFGPSKSDTLETEETTPVETTTLPSETMATVPPTIETIAETTPAPVYKTTSSLNVRSEPSTAGQKLGLLEAGTIVNYVEDYDDEWTVINYNGTQAYVNSQYLTHD